MKRSDQLKRELDNLLEKNDGTIEWVEEVRELMIAIDKAEAGEGAAK